MTEQSNQLQHERLADFLDAGEDSFRLLPEDAPGALEAILFASGDPVPLEKLQQITGLERSQLRVILNNMADRCQRDRQRGILLREIDGSWLLCTKPGQSDVLRRLFQPRHRPPLSQAAYETLAIIAYNQPVTRAQVEAVRGVNSDSIIGRLIERNLVCEAGSLDAPGRPTLFATTDQFLLDFGLRSVKDLPPMEMLMYGTLRDFENSLEEAAGRHRDNQMTIDQLVQVVGPGQVSGQAIGRASGQTDGTETAAPAEMPPDGETMPGSEVLQLSGAFFADEPATDSLDDEIGEET